MSYRGTPVRFIGGALLASALAGPIGVVLMLGYGFVEGLPTTMDNLVPMLGLVVLALMFALPFGFVVALLPNVFATMALAHLGVKRPATRHPLVWAAAGLALGGVIGALWMKGEPGGAVWMSATGVLCALICRWRTRWFD